MTAALVHNYEKVFFQNILPTDGVTRDAGSNGQLQ